MEDPELDADLRRRMAGDLPRRAPSRAELDEYTAQVNRARSHSWGVGRAWIAFGVALVAAVALGVRVRG
jgi:hypothetical protein